MKCGGEQGKKYLESFSWNKENEGMREELNIMNGREVGNGRKIKSYKWQKSLKVINGGINVKN